MPARCFIDNCHLFWTEEVDEFNGPAYEGHLNIDGNSSLYCNEGEGGLNVKVADLNDDGNLLTKEADGTLRAALGLAEHVAQGSSTFASVPSDAASGTPAAGTLDLTYDNNSGQEQLVIFRGQFHLHYDVLREGSPVAETASLSRSGNISTQAPSKELIPFNAQWVARLRRGLNGGSVDPVVADHFSTSGVVIDSIGENRYKSEWRGFTWYDVVSNGGSIQFQCDIFHDGTDQTLNISTSPAQQLDDEDENAPARGFRVAGCHLYALPIRVA